MNCTKCIHENLCVIKAFPSMFENTQWYDGENCKMFTEKKDFPNVEIELSEGCKGCVHSSVCYEVENLKCRRLFTWYQAESGCPHFKNKADFVEVVRCKDCKERYQYEEFDRDIGESVVCNSCFKFNRNFGDNGFCSYGEKNKTRE